MGTLLDGFAILFGVLFVSLGARLLINPSALSEDDRYSDVRGTRLVGALAVIIGASGAVLAIAGENPLFGFLTLYGVLLVIGGWDSAMRREFRLSGDDPKPAAVGDSAVVASWLAVAAGVALAVIAIPLALIG